MRHAFIFIAAIALATPYALRAQDHQVPAMPATAASPASIGAAEPAPAASSSVPDRPDLDDIRNFTRVYEIIRQAYVKKVDNKELMDAAITGMLSKLDPHSAWLDHEGMQALSEETAGKYAGLGVMVTSRDHRLVVIAPIDDTPAAKAGLKPGDVILKVDGAPVDPQDVQTSIDKLRGKPGSKIALTILHDKAAEPVTKTLTRALISMTSVKVRELEPGYAYIRISQFQRDTGHELNQKLSAFIDKHGMPKGAILDLRSNPGGLVSAATSAADTFLNDGMIVSTRGRIEGSDLSFHAHPGDLLKGASMVVLVDHGTASAAEILSGALHDHHRALVMGQRTFGKGVVQTVLPVDKDHVLKLTTARYYTPNGTSIQAEGITPDIIIPNLIARTGDTPPSLIDSEADLPHHLTNENSDDIQAARASSTRQLDDSSKLAERDYPLAQALSVLKGLALSQSSGKK